jgi:hypothetical protein
MSKKTQIDFSTEEADIKEIIEICNKTNYPLNNNINYKYYIIEPPLQLTKEILFPYKLIKTKLNPKSKIPLYVIFGLSLDSFSNNLKIINNNIEKIKDK